MIKMLAISLRGIRPIMFDRYPGDNKTQLEPLQKVYLSSEDGKTVVMPSENLVSFLTAQNTESAPKRLLGRGWRAAAMDILSFVSIDPFEIPFLRNGKPITLENGGFYVKHNVARVKKGSLAIPSPKSRPVLPTPWNLDFQITFHERDSVTAALLKKLFVEGGIAIGLGTYRGVYGKFAVDVFDVAKTER